MVQRDVRLDARVFHQIEHLLVEGVPGIVGRPVLVLQPRPGQGEAVVLHSRPSHVLDVVLDVLEVADALPRGVPEPARVGEVVPRRARAIAAVPLDLERARRDAEREVLGKQVVLPERRRRERPGDRPEARRLGDALGRGDGEGRGPERTETARIGTHRAARLRRARHPGREDHREARDDEADAHRSRAPNTDALVVRGCAAWCAGDARRATKSVV